MLKLLAIALLATVVAGCGGSGKPAATPTGTPSATAEHDLEGYSEGVKEYYGQPHTHAEEESGENGFGGDREEDYHRPPDPPEAGLGETITLTGTNLGIRMGVTVTGVESVRAGSKRYVAVKLRFENTGIAVYENELREAAVTYGDGKPRALARGAEASCSNGFEALVRLDVGRRASGCALFPVAGAQTPDRLQLALEAVPTTAGGIWRLR